MPTPEHDPPVVGWLDDEPEPATAAVISGEPHDAPAGGSHTIAGTPRCTRCHAEPRHSGSKLGVRCLWPGPLGAHEVGAHEVDANVIGEGREIARRAAAAVEECARCGTVGPVDMACAGCEPFPRSPRGLTDDGARDLPPPLCTLTAWCLRGPGHDGSCTPRPGDAYPPPDFGAAMATRRRA